MHPTNASNSSKTSSTPVASSLRPRNRRLISGLDDEQDLSSVTSQANSPSLSPFASRTASPIPSTHLPRSTSHNPSANGRSFSAQGSKPSQPQSPTLSGVWGNSWSTIQGLASTVLGSEIVPKDKQTRRRRPLEATHRRTSSSAPPKQWGPQGASDHVGAGTQEERGNLVRALKRRDLLAANDQLYSDTVGRLKRRTSDERLSTSAPPGENEDRDALVYIHRVKPTDTLAGITIKYNCQAAIVRKANRMWPNDTIQIRRTIMIPVDACGVKGRPVTDPNALEQEDILLGGYGDSTHDGKQDPGMPGTTNGWPPTSTTSAPSARPPSSAASQSTESDQPWKHDSWVLLPNAKEATEIGRLPRRALGFFPPARRKSVAYSDNDHSTPSHSFDLPRSSISTNTSHTRSPSQSTLRPSLMGSPRTSSSTIPTRNRMRSTSASTFALHGPGGVGTFGKNVRSPGPAQDGLNKLFASHLPNVAPPPGQEYFTPWAPSLLELNNGPDAPTSMPSQYGSGGVVTPTGGGIDLQNVGGAIEGWIRKMATQTSKALAETSSNAGKRPGVPVIGTLGGDIGDLIELRDDAFDIGGDDDDELGRGRPSTAAGQSRSTPASTARPDTSLAIRERGKRSTSKND